MRYLPAFFFFQIFYFHVLRVLLCSPGAVLDLAKLLPGQFKSGQVVCPIAQKVCPTLGCSGGCANGYCWQVQQNTSKYPLHVTPVVCML
jgi:hypothetical protein